MDQEPQPAPEKVVKTPLASFIRSAELQNTIPDGFTVAQLSKMPSILRNAQLHAEQLRFAKVVPCDVCIGNFVQDTNRRIELGGRIFGEAINFSPDQMTPELLNDLYPEWDQTPSKEDGRVRVHGIDNVGSYVTYCHFCDADMCLSQIKSGPDWDSVFRKHYRLYLLDLPQQLGIRLMSNEDWEKLQTLNETDRLPEEVDSIVPAVKGYNFSGSTSWSVGVNLLTGPGRLNMTNIQCAHEGRVWTVEIRPEDDYLIQHVGAAQLYDYY